jgi:redox-sensitive bicupin YhaK (pirin superfamily)
MTSVIDQVRVPRGASFVVHRAEDRGPTRFGWLDSRHSFSFGRFHNPEMMGFRALRVINDDRIAAGGGFPEHPHDNMEIVSYVVHGALAHKDSLGNGSTIHPGDIQWMSAGTGIRHSEFNPSETDPGRFLQIWIIPDERGLTPDYAERATGVHDHPGALRTIVSPEGGEHAVRIRADVSIDAGVFREGQSATRAFGAARFGWIQVVRGGFELTVAGPEGDGKSVSIGEGDGVELTAGTTITLVAKGDAEVLVFDLA